MKFFILILVGLISGSCGTYMSKYSGRGTTDEEKMYFMIKEDYENGNYMSGFARVKAFERKFPKSDKLCEVLSYKGDSHTHHGYIEVGLEEYQAAKKKCDEVGDKERSKVLEEKIAKFQKKSKKK